MEELEEVESEEFDPGCFDHEILSKPGVKLWTNSFIKSPIPLLILDKELNIIWANYKFHEIFGNTHEIKNTPLNTFFSQSIDEKLFGQAKNKLGSKQNSFTWKGRVEKKGASTFSVITNLIVLPVFYNPGDLQKPISYACILDNVSEEYKNMLKMTFMSLLEASRLKDNDTGNHISRVNSFARALTEALNKKEFSHEIDNEFIENIGYLAAMHDVGKIGTPDDILNKNGPLEEWEREIMTEHTINGAFILSTYPHTMAKEIALYHHEKWDGSGYPYGFTEDMIPLCARIVAVADVYDALRMKRSYKEAFSHEKAKNILIAGAGKHFDPVLIDTFLEIEDEFSRIFDSMED